MEKTITKTIPFPSDKIITSIFWLMALLIILSGILIRAQVLNHTVIINPIRADAADYYHYAKNLHDHGIYSRSREATNNNEPKPDALRSPGFPFFASTLFSSTPEKSLRNLQIAQTILQIITFLSLSVLLIIRLSVAQALIPIFLLWTFPHFISINSYYLSESLFTSLICMILACSLWPNQHDICNSNNYFFVCIGLLIGLASLTRPVLQYFPFFLLIAATAWHRRIRKHYILLTLAGLLPTTLWGIRNLIVIGSWSDPTLMINGLYHGSFPYFMYNNDPSTFGYPYKFDPLSNQIYEGISTTAALIWDRAQENLDLYSRWYLVGKQLVLWQWDLVVTEDIYIYPTIASPYYESGSIPGVSHTLHKMLHPAWMLLAFTGLGLLIRKCIKTPQGVGFFWFFSAALFLYAILIHVVVAPYPRYAIPFKLAAMMMTLYAIKEIYQWIPKKRSV